MEREFFASCLGGLERALADELKSLGVERVRPLGGGVAFFCDATTAMRACLWSRLASRILLVVGRTSAKSGDALYAGALDIAWEDVLADGATMAVRAHGTNDGLRNTRFTALKTKDAVADHMRAKGGKRPAVDTAAPRASIEVRIREDRATLSLDFSGEALNHRPYLSPDEKDDAGLACSLAAGALALADWPDMARNGAAFIDPACRDGILLVEAALAACDCAPNLRRNKWGFEGWAHFDRTAWNELLAEANERFETGLKRLGGSAALEMTMSERPDQNRVLFVGASTSSPAIARARKHARQAGMRPVVSVELADAADMRSFIAQHKAVSHAHAAMVASNLEATSRAGAAAHILADEAAFAAACTVMGTRPTARFAALDAQNLEARFGTAPTARHAIGRGRAQASVEIFDQPPAGTTRIEIPDSAGGSPHAVDVLEQASEQFAARLRKVFKERRKWAAREGISCYRIYDSDLPDYAVAIDWYTGAGTAHGNSYLHIAEYAPPSSVDADKARRRFQDVLAIAPVVCGIRPDHVFSKTRVRDKGGAQYRNAGTRPYVTTIQEAGHLFEVDLASHLDTGLFLDHRLTRALIGDKAHGTRFLNLFAYTGTASVYAAAGKAASTTTVDLSQKYLDWARRNMAANGFEAGAHSFVKADVMRWITEARRTGERFDLVFVDPPTFSNSKAMGKRTWDVQRDHVEL
ncbi:MAG TPA: bifunctional 23S rRNA (guanine(2069)-N(7))-methyltransferase RlmK/23S rRNA (guanine(2445)-N(2))-methyltransferase RlmL, partial [Eggerthellaceae bacterium]|nr:bifunctional 23S rRNA (guanine(2069)-N(7))-methyltransferase RlmK/23S rRNA (guanine(2445)-N(2))-methyltransferase RlmL [Eggerthellaceae bacterium]